VNAKRRNFLRQRGSPWRDARAWCSTMSKLISAVCVAGVLMAPVAALAHHSGAMFETKKTVTVTGTVREFEYVNPHAWLYVAVTDDKGEETLWGFEAEGPSALMRAGIKNNALQPGDLDDRFHESCHFGGFIPVVWIPI
jgi:Family of unknown function (DUF6152)